ncbi:MAG: type II toxin-antitoxin system RelE/ParE family toxin [Ferruginibacter sp.]
MGNYILTNKAVEDLSKIWHYTVDVWSATQADKYYYMLIDSCQELVDEKVFGKNYHEVDVTISGFKIGQHIIFYRKVKGNEIEIARILHSRMDLKSRMQE